MESGGWGVGGGECGMESGGWRVGGGEWGMESGECRVGDGECGMESGGWGGNLQDDHYLVLLHRRELG